MIAERALISAGPEVSMERASQRLREVWAQRIVDCVEGLVLKAGESWYGDWKLPWVKVRMMITAQSYRRSHPLYS